MRDGELIFKGRLGADVQTEQGRDAAQLCALNIFAWLNQALAGECCERIKKCVQLRGFVASTDNFTEHGQVLNGASELMQQVLGEAGHHTRLAVGVTSLPLGAPVEIDAVFAL